MNKKIFILMVFVTLFLFCRTSESGSIWAKRSAEMGGLYTDDVARNIGDILTIKIKEDSTIDNKAKRKLEKSTDRSVTFNGKIGDFTDLGEFGTTAESSNTLDSKADYKDERTFEDSVTVVVMDVLANGNLVVMGTRDRRIAGDVQTIEVSGIVRPSDITYDNSVTSDRVANFRIVTSHRGVAADFNRPGWLGRLLDILWPF